MITWRRVTENDFALLASWLAEPHVARWWNHETSAEAVRRDFGPAARGEEPSEDLLALIGGRPVGLLQRSRLEAYPEELEAYARLVTVPGGAIIIDYLIGDPALVGLGLGPRMIASAAGRIWEDFPGVPCILTSVPAANRASWRALEKAGFARVAEGPMTPDNPIDDALHYVYRLDRPPQAEPPGRGA